MSYRSIVVGTDGSASAGHAVERAIALASAAQARLVIVTAFVRDDDAHDELPADVRWQVTDSNEADAHARRARDQARDAGLGDVVVQAIEGEPADKLLETARDFNADLVVVGSVGLTSTARFVLGSVAGTVMHHAECDVLIAHTHV